MRKRYHSFNRYLKQQFGRPVFKIPLEAGFSCPNRDGTVGYGGCTFCSNKSFSVYADTSIPVEQQIAEIKQRVRSRHPGALFFAYFQAYTNTYADPQTLKSLYDPLLDDHDIVGLSIGTRPDCVPDPVLDLIAGYQSSLDVWMEYGLQTIHDHTLQLINRGHTARDFVDAASRSRERGLKVCAHVILGLPGESLSHALATARALNTCRVSGVKIHHLQVIQGTRLAQDYLQGHLQTLSAPDYVNWVCSFLEELEPGIVIQRLVGDALDDEALLAPRWNMSKAELIRAIDRELETRGSGQGSRIPRS